MKKDEILQFVKDHTPEFEKELRRRKKCQISFPRTTFARTAACNIQRKRDFDQDQAIQKEFLAFTDYLIEVGKFLLANITYFSGHGQWKKIDTCQNFGPLSKAYERTGPQKSASHGL